MTRREGAERARSKRKTGVWWLGGVAAMVVACAGTTRAQEPARQPEGIVRPLSAKRLVRIFDFEELNNPDPVPQGWVRELDDPTGRLPPRGFPWFNTAEFDRTQGAGGSTSSVRLPTKGGSTILRLQPGEIPIFPDADYAITAKVRTTGLEHARAFVTARLLDQNLKPIPVTEVRSAPVGGGGDAGWQTVRVVVEGGGKHAAGAFMQIDLELLQPRHFAPQTPSPGTISQHRIRREDVAGAANFDDLTVALLPRSEFKVASASGVFAGAERPAVLMSARDQGGDPLTATARLLDIEGNEIDRKALSLDPSGQEVRWEPIVRTAGWYRAVLDIDASGLNVSSTERWLVHLPLAQEEKVRTGARSTRSEDLARFGLVADMAPEWALGNIVSLIETAGTRFVILPAFDAAALDANPADARASLRQRMPMIESMLSKGQQVTFALSRVPESLAGAMLLDSSDAIGLSARDAAAWTPYLEPTLDVYGQRVLRYQIGRSGDSNIVRQDCTEGLLKAETLIARLVPGPKMILPWPADNGLPEFARPRPVEPQPGAKTDGAVSTVAGPLVDGVTLQFPSGFAPSAMSDLALIRDDRAANGLAPELTVVPERTDLEKFGARASAVEVARRMAEFWAALGATPPNAPPARFALSHPWVLESDRSRSAMLPAPELPVLVNMAQRLSGRRVVGLMPAPPGVRAFLLAERSGTAQALQVGESLKRACVVAWNVSASAEDAYVNVFTPHGGVEVVDMFGNVTSVAAPETGEIQTRIALSDAPVFIEGVDAYLALFSASFRFTPTFVPATSTDHEHRIELTNPWPVRITGQLQLRETPQTDPKLRTGEWSISPNLMDFAIAPGQRISLPVTLAFGAGTLAGVKEFTLAVKVMADRQYPSIRLETSVEVGLKDLEITTDVQIAGGSDVVVIATVLNKSDRVRTLRVELAAKDVASQHRAISDLPPGETIQKQFVIRDGVRRLGGRHVRVTLADEESAARLNKAAFVPDAP